MDRHGGAMIEPEKALTESEFCELARISRATALRLRRAGQLVYCQVGTRILYRAKHVAEFLDKHEVQIESATSSATQVEVSPLRARSSVG